MKFLVLIIPLCLSFFSCLADKSEKKVIEQTEVKSEVKDGNLYSINIERALDNVKQTDVPLSVLGGTIEYIPLETKSESLFGGGKHGLDVQLVSDKIILMNMKLFDRKTGRYLGNLMKKGQGPEEYIWIRSTSSDDEREEFYLCDISKQQIYVVDYNGVFLKSVPCGDDVSVLNLGSGNILIARGNSLDDTYDDFYVKNIETDDVLLKRRSSALNNIKSLDDCPNIFVGNRTLAMGKNKYWKYGKNIHYYDYLTDSVYSIGSDLKVRPLGAFLMGNLKMTKAQFEVGALSRDFFVWNIWNVIETSDKILIHIGATRIKPIEERKSFLIVYSKSSKETDAYRYAGLQNDVDDMVPFYPKEVQCTSYFYDLISAEKLKERMDESLDRAQKEHFKMIRNIKFDDNDIVGILR